VHLLKATAKFAAGHSAAAGLRGVLAVLLLALCGGAALAGESVQIKGVRMWPAPESTRLVLDLSAPATHNLFVLANPDRVVVDIEDAALVKPITGLDYSQGLIKGIRTAPQGKGLRMVLDLRGRARSKSFVLRPNQEYGHRLVVDLDDLDRMAAAAATKPATGSASDAAPRPPAGDAGAVRDIIVAIDAGHGGEDPGAIGPNGTREKDVVLAIARRLQLMVDQEPGMRAIMIRSGDYYVSLGNRIRKAREQRADLFISIHADAFRDQRARGSSVYTLSQRGASSEYARLLADKENASDLVGGVSLDDKDDLLASVLLDLSQTATIEASNEAAARVLKGLRGVGQVHKARVEQAGFRVLKAPDVPSMLVETAFISNPAEERNLRSSSHQNELAKAIMAGIRGYFANNPPPGTRLAKASREHVISQGETLAGIARNYRVSVQSLRDVNGLRSDAVRVGDRLRIPPS